MQPGLLPLFPLEVVLLPGGQLPLHIFEDRYKEMIAEVRQHKAEFGVIFATKQGLADFGCTAVVDTVLQEYPDGRLDILTVARRRFELLLLNQERSFLQGTVEFFDDDPNVDAPVDPARARVIEAYNSLQAVASGSPLSSSQQGDPQLSFLVAQSIGDLNLRQALLSKRSESERLGLLLDFLPSYTAQQRRVHSIERTAPRNGHGHHPVK
ncbi:MAG: LON peptidase substrate-binding domain-containing protein [Acidobacteriota bacterium]